MAFEIRDDVPMPRRAAGRQGSKYPLADLDVGQSFLVDEDIKATTVRSAVGAFMKRNPGAGKFALRNEEQEDGSVFIGVWRTE